MRVGMILAALCVCLAGLAYGQNAAPESDRFPFVFDISPVLWGADIGVGYRGLGLASGVDTIFWVYAGGGYEQLTYMRLPDGSLITGAAPGGINPDVDLFYNRWSGRWQLGIAQGIAWNPRIKGDLLEAFTFYRGRYDANINADPGQLIFRSSIPDKDGLFQNAALAGVKYNDLLLDTRNKTWSGAGGEASVEWGPAALSNTLFGRSDYARFNLSARAFLPLYESLYEAAPESLANLFSLYAGDFFSADYAMGDYVPLNIRQTFGGLHPRVGLGGALRGVDDGSMDTNLKLVNNFEIRANLPALWLPDLVPGVLLYWDAGYYDQLGGQTSPSSGFVSSVGAGVFIDLFDITSLTVYIHYRLTGENAKGSPLTLFELKFSAQF
jgi:hypothetical protein